MKFHSPAPQGQYITQTYDQHVKRAKANGWCWQPKPGCKAWYYGGIDYGGVFIVTAPQHGRIQKTKQETSGYGHSIYIDHAEGYMSILGHLKPGSVRNEPGDIIVPDQDLATSDNTGFSTGSHLHWEVRLNGKPIDPQPLITLEPLDESEPIEPPKPPEPPELPPTPVRLKALASPWLNIRMAPNIQGYDVGGLGQGDEFTAMEFIKPDDGSIWAKIDGLYCAVYYDGEWLAEVLK